MSSVQSYSSVSAALVSELLLNTGGVDLCDGPSVKMDGSGEWRVVEDEQHLSYLSGSVEFDVLNRGKFSMVIQPDMLHGFLNSVRRNYKLLDEDSLVEGDFDYHLGSGADVEVVEIATLVGLVRRLLDSSGTVMASSHSLRDLPVSGYVAAALSHVGSFSTSAYTAAYVDLPCTVKWLAWLALQLARGYTTSDVMNRSWLPVTVRDFRSRVVIASKLFPFLKQYADITFSELCDTIFSGFMPAELSKCLHEKESFSAEDAEGVAVMFREFKDGPQFYTSYVRTGMGQLFSRCGLEWDLPSLDHLCFHMSYKNVCVEFNRIMPVVSVTGQQLWCYVVAGSSVACGGDASQLVVPSGGCVHAAVVPTEVECRVANTFHFTGVLYHQLCFYAANRFGYVLGSEYVPPDWVEFTSEY